MVNKTRPLYITTRRCRWFKLLLDGGERIIVNSSAASILAIVLDLVAVMVFLRQSPSLAVVVSLVSYPVWWFVSNLITVFCWVVTLMTAAAVSRQYRLFVALRRIQSGASTLRPVALVITDDNADASSKWLLLKPLESGEDTLLRGATSTCTLASELPRPAEFA